MASSRCSCQFQQRWLNLEAIRVPKILAPTQVSAYIDQGYLVLANLLARSEVDTLRLEVVRLCRGEYPIANFEPLLDGTSDEDAVQRVSTIYSPHAVSATMLEFVKHATICGVISQLSAAHRANWDGSAKFVQSTLFIKPPGMQGHAWHQDDRSIQTWDQSLCAAWIPLDDTTIKNGCLWIVPGSHRYGYLYPMRPHKQPTRYQFLNEAYGFDSARTEPVELRVGSVLFFSGSLLHSSQPNQSSEFRRSLVNHYCNAWSEVPYYDNQTQRLIDLRTVIPVAGIDPYQWKGYDRMPASIYVRYRGG